MVLSSQAPRGVGGRGYTSSRRKTARWKAALILLVAVAAVWLLFFTGGDDPADGPTPDGDTPINQPGATPDASPGAASSSAAPPARPNISNVLTNRSAAPLGETAPAAGAQPAPTAGVSTPSGPPTPATSAASTPTPAPAPRPTPAGPASTREALRQLAEGFELIERGNAVAGRAMLSSVLLGSRDQLSTRDANRIRTQLSDLNARLVFSPEAVPNDTATTSYVVQTGDRLGAIAARYKVPYPFLELINGIDARRMQVGQTLKLINGPIHARVDKSEFVMDLYVFGTDGTPAFLTSFPVGLGENDNTPLGKWLVTRGKVQNPDWRNPRTNEYFPADHPDNPIGEYWVPITGLEGDAVGRTGFGIHGTNDPASIGHNRSMGCVRLGDADIALVYSMLEPGASEVTVVP